MASISFTGNVGADAELRHTQNGAAMLTFRAAESKSRRLDDGSWEELNKQWFDVTLFGPAGEALHQFILKGARVKVAGDFWRRDYESQNGGGTSLDVKAVGVEILKQAQQNNGFNSSNFNASQSGGFNPPQDAWGAGAGWQ